MKKVGARLMRVLAVLLLVGFWAVSAPPTAHAAADRVKDYRVTLAIQGDGSIQVRQEFDWVFGASGRHGIKLGYPLTERWDADPTQEVGYQIDDFQVSSPTGAPTGVNLSKDRTADGTTLTARIGDPDTEVQGTAHTYVVSYTLRGALRTFDGKPELFWDLTSMEFPPTQHFTATVTAPGGVTAARCLQGRVECAATVTDAGASFSGDDLRTGDIWSVVAGLQPGQVEHAEPTLKPRQVDHPEVTGFQGEATLTPQGVLQVRESYDYLLPTTGEIVALKWQLPVRRRWSATQDQLFTISQVQVHVDNTPVGVDRRDLFQPDEVRSNRSHQIGVRFAPTVAKQRVVLSYQVTGAVAPHGDHAAIGWPLPATEEVRAVKTLSARWMLPGPVSGADCDGDFADATGTRDSCPSQWQATVAQNTVQVQTPPGRSGQAMGVVVTVPAGALPGVQPDLQPSLDQIRERHAMIGLAGAFGGGAVATVAGFWWRWGRRRPALRYANVPPGVVAAGQPTRPTTKADHAPVRFEPPEVDLATASVLHLGGFKPAVLAATMVKMAVDGALIITTRPLTLGRGDAAPQDKLERDLAAIRPFASRPPARASRRQLAEAVKAGRRFADRVLSDPSYVTSKRADSQLKLGCFSGLVWLVVTVAVMLVVKFIGFPLIGDSSLLIGLAVPVGAAIGLWVAHKADRRPAWTAQATALHDQIDGFRQYLATAEADQLDFEANHDILREFLPWAVLFGLTERWARVCRELAEAGRISDVDLGYLSGNVLDLTFTVHAVESLASGATRRLTAAETMSSIWDTVSSGDGGSWGGGSGSSSGFSSGASGGGGGGGTSASSW